MSSIGKIVNDVKYRVSKWMLPADQVRVKHVQTDRFNILVFANEVVGRIIWQNIPFEKGESAVFVDSVRPDDVCLDIGGNVGYFSMLMASCATQGHVHIFEPIPLNAAMIRTNLLLNGFAHATVNEMALSDREGDVQFSVSTDSAYSSMRPTGTSAEVRSITVRTSPLDSYLEHNSIDRVDVVKVDVEGAEDLVLKGAGRLFTDASRRPRLVMLELCAANLAPYGSTVADVLARMGAWGYSPYVVTQDGDELRPYNHDTQSDVYNIFFVPS